MTLTCGRGEATTFFEQMQSDSSALSQINICVVEHFCIFLTQCWDPAS